MNKLSFTKMGVAVGGLGLVLTAGAGVASAQPDLGPAVDTTCSYEQLTAALNAQDPSMAAAFNSSPQMQAGIRQFLAAPRDQRTQMAQQVASMPANQPILGTLSTVFSTCNNF
jgi:hemophore-related protein